MGYAVYEDINAQRQGMERWAGYGMPGIRDMPTCTSVIFRGLDIKWEIICTYSQDGDIEKGDLLIVEGAHVERNHELLESTCKEFGGK